MNTGRESPRLRTVFDAVERRVAAQLEQAVRTGGFAGGLGLALRARKAANGVGDALTRRLWHLLNLPAGSDVARARRQVAALDREVRNLSLKLDEALQREVDDGTRTARARRPREA